MSGGYEDHWHDEDEVEGFEEDNEDRSRLSELSEDELDEDIFKLEEEINDLTFLLYLTWEEQNKLDRKDPEAVAKAVALANERRRVEYQKRKAAKSASIGADPGGTASQPRSAGEPPAFPKNDVPLAFQDVPRCQHVKSNNQACGSPALKRRRYCYFHDESRARNAKRLRMPVLEDRRAIQMAITKICQGITDQTIDAKRGSTLLYGLQVASAAVPKMVARKPKP